MLHCVRLTGSGAMVTSVLDGENINGVVHVWPYYMFSNLVCSATWLAYNMTTYLGEGVPIVACHWMLFLLLSDYAAVDSLPASCSASSPVV